LLCCFPVFRNSGVIPTTYQLMTLHWLMNSLITSDIEERVKSEYHEDTSQLVGR
jgi:hypothetical protein